MHGKPPCSRDNGSTADLTTPCGGLRKLAWVALLVLCLVVQLGRVWASAIHAPTDRELHHLVAGLRYLQSGDALVYPVNPPLGSALVALPAFLMGAPPPRPAATAQVDRRKQAITDAYAARCPEVAASAVRAGRWLVLLAVCGATALLLTASRKRRSDALALAAALITLDPLYGTASIEAAPDALAGLAVLACYLIWSDCLRGSARDVHPVWTALLLGLAIGLKFTAALYVPTLLIVVAASGKQRGKRCLVRVLLSSCAVYGLLWLTYAPWVIRRFLGFESISPSAALVEAFPPCPRGVGPLLATLPGPMALGIIRQASDFAHFRFCLRLQGYSTLETVCLAALQLVARLPLTGLLAMTTGIGVLVRMRQARTPARDWDFGLAAGFLGTAGVAVAYCASGALGYQRYAVVALPTLWTCTAVLAQRTRLWRGYWYVVLVIAALDAAISWGHPERYVNGTQALQGMGLTFQSPAIDEGWDDALLARWAERHLPEGTPVNVTWPLTLARRAVLRYRLRMAVGASTLLGGDVCPVCDRLWRPGYYAFRPRDLQRPLARHLVAEHGRMICEYPGATLLWLAAPAW